jgi:hypothetical protein
MKFRPNQIVHKQYRNGDAVTIEFEIETANGNPTNTYVVKDANCNFSECPAHLLGEKNFEKKALLA